jgi:hypothetical protein
VKDLLSIHAPAALTQHLGLVSAAYRFSKGPALDPRTRRSDAACRFSECSI